MLHYYTSLWKVAYVILNNYNISDISHYYQLRYKRVHDPQMKTKSDNMYLFEHVLNIIEVKQLTSNPRCMYHPLFIVELFYFY